MYVDAISWFCSRNLNKNKSLKVILYNDLNGYVPYFATRDIHISFIKNKSESEIILKFKINLENCQKLEKFIDFGKLLSTY